MKPWSVSALVERLAQWASEFKPVAAARLRRLRHPTWHGVGLALCAVLAGVMLYVLFLIPFTPSIGDIRKARLELPAQVYSADGKLFDNLADPAIRANRLALLAAIRSATGTVADFSKITG